MEKSSKNPCNPLADYAKEEKELAKEREFWIGMKRNLSGMLALIERHQLKEEDNKKKD